MKLDGRPSRRRLKASVRPGRFVICVECYPGCFETEIEKELVSALEPQCVMRAGECYLPESAILSLCARDLGDDPVFAFMGKYELSEFLDERELAKQRSRLSQASGLVLVIGTGATLLAEQWDLLVYCDMARWEIQQRQRAGEITNLGLQNGTDRPQLKYKRAYFVDWRVADRLKKQLLPRIDFLLDTNQRDVPKMITGSQLAQGLKNAAHQPFRVVPFFDPGPWGGQWMKEVCDLPRDAENYAWCFDCVPEENSLLLGFGDVKVEIPSINLVFQHPHELLGEAVHARFGTEFPIRFDFLDTMDGGNLSFQVHPLTEYIQEQFGMSYTQDESYYLLDAAEEGCVYLGLKESVDRKQMTEELLRAQEGENQFDADKYVNRFPARKHDHFLIPAGTPALFRQEQHGARNQRHAVHLHLQNVGLGPAGTGRHSAPDPSRTRFAKHPVGSHHAMGREEPGQCDRTGRQRHRAGAKSAPACTSVSLSRRGGTGSLRRSRTPRTAA